MIIAFVEGQKANVGAGYEKLLFIKPFPIFVSVGAHSSWRRREPESGSACLP
jgi:hypothetical protein